MSNLWQNDVIGICCSDIHFSHNPPIARSCEKNWYSAMGKQLDQVIQLTNKHKCPLIIAGDIFNKPENPSQLVNWVIQKFKQVKNKVFAIPGQHDLLHHNIKDIHKTSYWTLALDRAIINLEKPHLYEIKNTSVDLFPFPWGAEIKPLTDCNSTNFSIAVCHRYVHTGKHTFPGADPNLSAQKTLKKIKGFDFAIFGDNHSGFKFHQIFNCGALIRRNSTERNYQPQVGMITKCGQIIPYDLNVENEIFSISEEEQEKQKVLTTEIQELLNSIDNIVESSESMGKALIHYLQQISVSEKVAQRIRRIISEIE